MKFAQIIPAKFARPLLTISVVAVGTATVLTSLFWFGSILFKDPVLPPVDPAPEGEVIVWVARITGDSEREWSEGSQPYSRRADLAAGDLLELEEGLIEITFYGGAIVILEGPAKFVVDTPGIGTLEVGRLTARVPPKAKGFIINTPTVRIVDVGNDVRIDEILPDGTPDTTLPEAPEEPSVTIPNEHAADPLTLAQVSLYFSLSTACIYGALFPKLRSGVNRRK